jgi:hypothetical protein
VLFEIVEDTDVMSMGGLGGPMAISSTHFAYVVGTAKVRTPLSRPRSWFSSSLF